MDTHTGQKKCVSCELCCDVEEPQFQQHLPLVFQIKNSIAVEKNQIKQ